MADALCWTISETLKLYIFIRFVLGFNNKSGVHKYYVFAYPLLVLIPAFIFVSRSLIFLKFIWKILFVYIFFEGKKASKLLALMINEIVFLLMDVVNAYLVVRLIYGEKEIYGQGYCWYEVISIIVLIAVAFFIGNKRNKMFKLLERIDSVYIIMMFLMLLTAAFNFISLELLKDYSSNERVRIFSTIINICSTLGVIIISLVSVYIKSKKDRAVYEKKQVDNLIRIERKYYGSLIKRDDSLKRIRHDIKGIISALNILISEGKLSEAKNYMAELKEYYEIESKVKTGNKIADVLLDELVEYFKDNHDVKVTVVGVFPQNMDIDDFYLSIILSNALKNAREAVERIKDQESFIDVEIINNTRSMILVVRNSADKLDRNFCSYKGDEEHGLGIDIMRDIAKKDGSNVSWDYNDGEVVFTWEKQIEAC